MDHGHNHSHGDFTSLRAKSSKAMLIVLALTLLYTVVEVVAGLFTGSLALIADAGHMLGDVGALVLALLASWFATRSASASKTYGYYRSEILAALANGMVLIGLSAFILYEAWQRLFSPPEIMSGPMMIVAVGGLVINLISMRLLSSSSSHSLNVKAAYLEVLGDMLGSVAVIVASAIIMFSGWNIADPIVSAGIGLMILPRTWLLIKECVHILMEGAPGRLNLDELRESILAVPGVVDIHDLHVWTITSAKDSMSAHVLIGSDSDADTVLTEVTRIARDQFALHHTTIQVERADCQANGGTCT